MGSNPYLYAWPERTRRDLPVEAMFPSARNWGAAGWTTPISGDVVSPDEVPVTLDPTVTLPPEGAAGFLLRTLRARRNRIVRHWFDTNRTNPLDACTVSESPDGGRELRFRDLAVDRGYADRAATRHWGPDLSPWVPMPPGDILVVG